MYINATKIANVLLEDCNYNRGVISQETYKLVVKLIKHLYNLCNNNKIKNIVIIITNEHTQTFCELHQTNIFAIVLASSFIILSLQLHD